MKRESPTSISGRGSISRNRRIAKDWYAVYKISYNSLIKLPYMKKYFENQSKWGQIPKEEDCKVYFRWDKNGIIITRWSLHECKC